jgi:hypothetical protein
LFPWRIPLMGVKDTLGDFGCQVRHNLPFLYLDRLQIAMLQDHLL